MFSNWFSGDECAQYRTSPHKQRMDHVGSSLLELRYANEVVRQHLHEWLRFSRHLEERGMPLLATDTDAVRQYVARRTSKTSPSRSRVLRASVRIFLDTDERGQFRRRVGSPPTTPAWFAPILTPYLSIPMMSITQSDLMPISAERSDAGLSQSETVIGISQEILLFAGRFCLATAGLLK